jgi:hypothetical protein
MSLDQHHVNTLRAVRVNIGLTRICSGQNPHQKDVFEAMSKEVSWSQP